MRNEVMYHVFSTSGGINIEGIFTRSLPEALSEYVRLSALYDSVRLYEDTWTDEDTVNEVCIKSKGDL